MAITESQKRSHEKYFKENYKQVKLSMPNAEAEALEMYCTAHKLSKAGFIRQLIRDAIQRDTTEYNPDN